LINAITSRIDFPATANTAFANIIKQNIVREV
jgi:hypothetical protein